MTVLASQSAACRPDLGWLSTIVRLHTEGASGRADRVREVCREAVGFTFTAHRRLGLLSPHIRPSPVVSRRRSRTQCGLMYYLNENLKQATEIVQAERLD
jgi:hypothetical protein